MCPHPHNRRISARNHWIHTQEKRYEKIETDTDHTWENRLVYAISSEKEKKSVEYHHDDDDQRIRRCSNSIKHGYIIEYFLWSQNSFTDLSFSLFLMIFLCIYTSIIATRRATVYDGTAVHVLWLYNFTDVLIWNFDHVSMISIEILPICGCVIGSENGSNRWNVEWLRHIFEQKSRQNDRK